MAVSILGLGIVAILIVVGLVGGACLIGIILGVGRASSKDGRRPAGPAILLGCLVPAVALGVIALIGFSYISLSREVVVRGGPSPNAQWQAVEGVKGPRGESSTVEIRGGSPSQPAAGLIRRQPETAYAPRPDDYQLHLTDDLAAWKKQDGVAPRPNEEAVGKAWIADAAGSEFLETGISGHAFTGGIGRAPGVSIRCRRPGPQGLIVGYSRQLEPDPAGAQEAARLSAADQLRALVFLATVREPAMGAYDTEADVSTYAAVDAIAGEVVKRRLEADQGLIAGSYDQEVPMRSFGTTMHRSAILVHADEPTIQSLVLDVRRRIQQGEIVRMALRRKIITTAASTVGLAFFIFLLYALLNAGTKGHFAWPLRFFSLAALVLLSAGILYLQGWFR